MSYNIMLVCLSIVVLLINLHILSVILVKSIFIIAAVISLNVSNFPHSFIIVNLKVIQCCFFYCPFFPYRTNKKKRQTMFKTSLGSPY